MTCFDQVPSEILARIILFLFEAHKCTTSIPFGPNGRLASLLALRSVCKRFDSSIIRHLASRLHVICPMELPGGLRSKYCPGLLSRLTFEAVKNSGRLRQNHFIVAVKETSRLLLANVPDSGHRIAGKLAFWRYATCHTAAYNLGLTVVKEAASSVPYNASNELDRLSAALTVAAHANDVDLLNRLIGQGVDVNHEHPYFGNALRIAAARGNEAMVKILLKMGASSTIEDNQGLTALDQAAYGGRASIVQLLLGRDDVDPNAVKSSWSFTPLNLAVQGRNVDAVRVLLAKEDVDVNHPALEKKLPLCVAIEHQDGEIARLLLDRADIDVNLIFPGTNNRCVLSKAIECCATSIVRLLLQHKDIDVNVRTGGGQMPIHLAAQRNYTQIVELLLAHPDCDPNATCNMGQTPLAAAAILGFEDTAKLLLAHPKIKADAKSKRGETPLIYAVMRGRTEIVSLLLERDDVDINHATNNGETSLLLAVRNCNVTITKLLLDHGADKEVNRDLIMAARHQHDLSVLERF